MSQKAIGREIALVYVGIAAATFVATRLRDVEPAADYVQLAVGAIFLLTAMKLAQREPDGASRFGIGLAGLLAPPDDEDSSWLGLRELARTLLRGLPSAARELGVALTMAAVVFPPFVIGFAAYYRPLGSFVPMWPGGDDAAPAGPADAAAFALAQVLVVALPEEALFRGYFQTRLTDLWPPATRILGVDVSIRAVLAQAALFAVVHYIVDFSPEKLAVFFPALLFAWLRAWRGGIGSSLLFHALSNVLADVLTKSWL